MWVCVSDLNSFDWTITLKKKTKTEKCVDQVFHTIKGGCWLVVNGLSISNGWVSLHSVFCCFWLFVDRLLASFEMKTNSYSGLVRRYSVRSSAEIHQQSICIIYLGIEDKIAIRHRQIVTCCDKVLMVNIDSIEYIEILFDWGGHGCR